MEFGEGARPWDHAATKLFVRGYSKKFEAWAGEGGSTQGRAKAVALFTGRSIETAVTVFIDDLAAKVTGPK
eukprot:6495900-Lingulodinium_polyedra.AAC.1